MKTLIVVLSLVAFASALAFPKEWELWKEMHGKEYKEDLEELRRQTVWEANKKFIESHNSVADKFGYTLAMNEFGDLTDAEFGRIFNGYQMQERSNTSNLFTIDPVFKPAASIDWRQRGYVTEVKNQGQCGGCWAFSATGSLEGQHFKQTGRLVSLSEQNLIDCSTAYGNHGCQGGIMDMAFRYIAANGGVDTESYYPYHASNGECRFSRSFIGATDRSYSDIRRGDENGLTYACGSVGPISVAIDASHSSFRFYHSGVYYEPSCSSTRLDHGVLIVGYGSEGGRDYYIVKNSWGASWGDAGYIKMARNMNNNCGIATQASYPIV